MKKLKKLNITLLICCLAAVQALWGQCISGDCTHGRGVYLFSDGSQYEGKFFEGKPDGWGSLQFTNQDQYLGLFEKGVRHGQGTFIFSNGRKITGFWENGKFLGESQTPVYQEEGCISGDCENGEGTYVYKNGEARYEGIFQNLLPHGNGVCLYVNGDRYEGDWMYGKFHGRGSLYLHDGKIISGYWKKGNFLGKVQQAKPTATTEPGEEHFGQEEPLLGWKKPRPVPESKMYAVIIGVAAYAHMPSLHYTDDDAYRIYAYLKSAEGGGLPDDQIHILVDEAATKKNIISSMIDVFYQARETDLVLLYFSGHGLKGSFLPIDFDGYNNKLFHREINAILENCQAKFKICIADACHSGSLLAMRGDVDKIMDEYYKTLAQSKPGTALVLSSKSSETSLESKGLRQGVFTHYLIRGLKGEADYDRNRLVSIEELFDFLYTGVREYTAYRQSPMIRGDFDRKMPVSVVWEE